MPNLTNGTGRKSEVISGEEGNLNKKFDLIVLGTGSAASTVAYKCRSSGWEVAVIDSRPFGRR